MASQETISRVGKILARATSSEPNEASAALQAAYKRMRRDQVGIRQLLTLPLSELYQEPLVKLVMLILENQPDLSPPERRKAFETYITLITDRFSGGEFADAPEAGEKKQEAETRARADADRRRQKECQQEAASRAEAAARAEATRAEAQRHAEEKKQRQKEHEAEEALRKEPHGGRDGPHERDSAGTFSPKKSETSQHLMTAVIGVGGLFLLIYAATTAIRGDPPVPSPSAPTLALGKTPALVDTAPVVTTTHAVAALNANLRETASSKGRLKKTLARGDLLTLVSMQDNFLEVRTTAGERGFISRELVIPAADLPRLLAVTAHQYVDARSPENRVETVLSQATARKKALFDVVLALTTRATDVVQYLEKLEKASNFDIDRDDAAATWFALAATASLNAGQLDDAYWDSRAAVEADPTSGDHQVALVLANYKLGNDDAVARMGSFMPFFAPASTNAWMLFALALTLAEGTNAEATKGAFVLAIRLSRNADTTRRYLQDLAENARKPRTREMIYAALADERESPELFAGAAEFRASRTP